jgi:hypothetical protein
MGDQDDSIYNTTITTRNQASWDLKVDAMNGGQVKLYNMEMDGLMSLTTTMFYE